MHPVVLRVDADGVGRHDAGPRGDGRHHRRGAQARPPLGHRTLPRGDVGQRDQDVGVRGGGHGGVPELQDEHEVEAVHDDVGAVHLVAAVGGAGPEVVDELLGLGEAEAAADLGVDGDGVDATIKFLLEAA